MSASASVSYVSSDTQDDTLLNKLMTFYAIQENMAKFKSVVNGESCVSLRIIDWFVTNYAKKFETEYVVKMRTGILKDLVEDRVFKVYHQYKLQLKSYSKKRFDSFCRWNRITIPCNDGSEEYIETTIGQLNFFKWSIENNVLDYIENHYEEIEKDMNARNSASRRKTLVFENGNGSDQKTRKKRQELTVVASKCIRKENVCITVKFDN